MRFPAARVREDRNRDHRAPLSRMKRHSSPAADGVALLAAAALLALAIWSQGATLLRSGNHLYATIAVTLVFASAARMARGVNTSGALAGAAVAFIFAGRDLRMFWMLFLTFIVTLAATRAGTRRKRRLDLLEVESGRSASQVISNVGVAALALALPGFARSGSLALAVLAELAADTTSSEVGAAWSRQVILITTWKRVKPGIDGGISLIGTMAGTAAAAIIAAGAWSLGLASGFAAILAAGAGIAGMLVDSLLGATFEQRGYLDNNMVNLLGTAAAALIAWKLS